MSDEPTSSKPTGRAAELIEHFQMTTLPVEGTYFVNTWISDGETPEGGPIGTAMMGLYLDNPVSRSLFHRLSFDEVWHFYGGDPIRLMLLHPDGTDSEVTMGGDPLAGQFVQYCVPARTWQAGELVSGGSWALFGCTLAPGFLGTCFAGGRISSLTAEYPTRAFDIARLGVPDSHQTLLPEGFTQ
jgi:uncharacterized protein